jgi:ribosomal protein L12E/L44/L45/RPP1/RPP2
MYLAQQQLAQEQGPSFDPESPANMGTLAQLAQQNQQMLQQQLALVEQNIGAAAAAAQRAAVDEVQARMETAKHTDTINAKLSSIYADNPILQSVPEIEDVIRYRVSQMEPKTIEEALSAFEKVSGDVAKAMGAKFSEARKEQAINKQNLVGGGIEPPGGAAVPANAPTSFRDPKTNVIDWSKLSQAAGAYIEGNRK